MEFKSKRKSSTIILLLFLCIVIMTVPLLINSTANFSGSDDAASNLISDINPDYKPWISSVITLPNKEVETLLFCLQTGMGAGGLGFIFGRLVEKHSKKK